VTSGWIQVTRANLQPGHLLLHALQTPAGAWRLNPRWLRRQVDLPEGTYRGRLALTLGALRNNYAVHVNGRHRVPANRRDPARAVRPPIGRLEAGQTVGISAKQS